MHPSRHAGAAAAVLTLIFIVGCGGGGSGGNRFTPRDDPPAAPPVSVVSTSAFVPDGTYAGALRRCTYAGDATEQCTLATLPFLGMETDDPGVARQQSAREATPEERRHHFDERWAFGGLTFVGAFSDLLTDLSANETAADYVRTKIRETVLDAETAERLSPDHTIGCKRLCSDSGYYETFNRPTVRLVDLHRSPIAAVTPCGLRIGGEEYRLDTLILACGFDAMTGALNRIDIRGRAGRSLKDRWRAGAGAYLGLAVPDFPNLFLMTGPGSPSVLANMVTGLEQHAEWISTCLAFMRRENAGSIEALPDAEVRWMEEVNAAAAATVFPSCNSWYVGANVRGKPRVFLPYIGGFDRYEAICNEVAASRYKGFRLT